MMNAGSTSAIWPLRTVVGCFSTIEKGVIYRVAQKERMFLKWVVVRRVKVGDLLWGYLKSKVFVRKPRTGDDLKVSIHLEIAAVPQEMLVNVMHNFEERLRTCVRQEGCHLSDIIFRN